MNRLGYLGLGSNVGDRRDEPAGRRSRLDARRGRARLLVGLRDRAGGRGARPARLLQRLRSASRRRSNRRGCSTPARPSSARSGDGGGARRRAPRATPDRRRRAAGRRVRATPTRLRLPHREVTTRRFVLVPLLELDPELEVPGGGRAADAWRRLHRVAGSTRGDLRPPSRRWVAGVLLVVDVGNTQTHFGAFDGRRARRALALRDRAASRPPTSSAPRCATCSRCAAFDFADLDASIVSVDRAGAAAASGRRWSRRYLGHEMPLVGPGLKTGMPIRDRQPARARPRPPRQRGRRLRARSAAPAWSSTSARRSRYDVVSADGRVPRRRHLAGRRDLARGALDRARPRSRRSTSTPPRALIGKSTVDAIRSGVIYGFAGQVDGIVGRLRDELGSGHRRRSPPAAWRGSSSRSAETIDRGRRPADADRTADSSGSETS